MKRDRLWLNALVVPLALILLGGQAWASDPCNPAEVVRNADLIIVGRVVAKPLRHFVLVRVDRYLKGSGVTYRFIMQPEASLWRYVPKETPWVMGLQSEAGTLRHRRCLFWVPPPGAPPKSGMTESDPARSIRSLGEGEPALPGIDWSAPLLWERLLLRGLFAVPVAALIILSVRAWWLRRKERG